MTVTPAKLEANRRNAKKSTGPKTAAGKKRSSRNGATHGIFCNDVVLPCESQAEFEALRDAFQSDLQAVGIAEMMFVDRIVIAAWKLKRLNRIEGLITDSYAEHVSKQYRRDLRQGGTDVTEMTFDAADVPAEQSQAIGFVDQTKSVERMGRHAQRLEMSISRAMRELRALQKERSKRTQSSPEPTAALDLQRVIAPEVEEAADDANENAQSEPKAECVGPSTSLRTGETPTPRNMEERTSGLKPAAVGVAGASSEVARLSESVLETTRGETTRYEGKLPRRIEVPPRDRG